MIGHRRDSTSAHRQGFTLLEVLLTLCLLVIIMSLAWPVLKGPIETLRLRRAADEVHAQWASARVQAMDSGRTFMFRYTTSGEQNRFRTECYTPVESSADPQFDRSFDGSTGGSGYAGAVPEMTTGTLPSGVTFLASQTESDSRATLVLSAADASSASGDDLSDPILFYPDGTTSTAELQLCNDRNRCIKLSLRGLTGTVNIGEVSNVEGHLP